MKIPVLLSFLLPTLLGQPTRAQELLRTAATTTPPAPIRDQGLRDDRTSAGSWAAGDAFKCSLADGVFTLVPYLGRHAPQSLPWRWRTIEATAGGVDLRQGQRGHEHRGELRFVRTTGLLTERWDVAAGGVEQSFVVAARPAAGELVVRGTFEGPWVAAPRAASASPVVFRDPEGRAELHYGAAVAIDANGRRWPVPVAVDGATLSLHVPPDVAAAATFPLLLDPLLNVYVIESGTTPSGSGIVDTCIDSVDVSDDMSVVRAEVRWASVLDGDLFVWKTRDDFVVSRLVYSDLDPNVQAFDASVAEVGNGASYVVAWSRGATANSSGITWFSLPADGYGPPTVRTLARPSGSSERSPRVAGRRGQVAGAGANALLVRLRETAAGTDRTEVWGSLLDLTTQTAGTAFAIATGGTATNAIDHAEPWVNRDAAGPNVDWVVAYQRFSASTDRWEVHARRVSHAGSLLNGTFTPDLPQGGPYHAMQPRVEGAGGRLLIAFVTAPTQYHPGKLSTFLGMGVYVQRFTWTSLNPVKDHAPVYLAASFVRDLELGGIAADSWSQSHWTLTYGAQGAAPTIAQLGYRGRVIRSTTLPGPGPSAGAVTFRPATIAFDRTLQQWQVLYGVRTSNAGVTGYHVYGGRYEYPALATPAVYGPTCGPGHIAYFRQFRVGSEICGVSLLGPTSDLVAVAALSLQSGTVPLQPLGIATSCTLLVDPAAPYWLGTIVGVTDASGDCRFALPLPENLAPCDLHAQWFTLQATGVFTATQGLRCEIR